MIFARAFSHPAIEAIADLHMLEHWYIAAEVDAPWGSEESRQMALTGFVDDLSNNVFEANVAGNIIDKLGLDSRLEDNAVDNGDEHRRCNAEHRQPEGRSIMGRVARSGQTDAREAREHSWNCITLPSS